MPHIEIHQRVDAPVADVWRELADIASHVEWMADAESIRFAGDQRTGVGTRFDCETRVGPLRTVDRMEVTEWRDGEAIGVRHTGLVTGEGRFTLRVLDSDHTEVTWAERLALPWYVGGRITGWVVAPVLRRIWRGNLRRFAARLGR